MNASRVLAASVGVSAVVAVFATPAVAVSDLQSQSTASSSVTVPENLGARSATRDYGTPTKAKGKACPFVGTVPVALNSGSLPYGSSLPGAAAVILPGPEYPTDIYGELCMSRASLAKARAGAPPAILVLVHGITYGTWYWDLPYRPARYSAVNYLIKRGYATLNIDRIGEGRSGHPPSPLVTSATNADAVHQLIEKLRAGEIGGFAFEHVGLVGHSYGTVTNWRETAVYNDADINIGTGYSDGVNPVTAGHLVSQSRPASMDPRTAGEPWASDPGYVQPLPGVRGISQFYNRANADPAVIALDEQLANTVTVPELGTFTQSEFDGSRRHMAIPTFLINGEVDNLVCGNNTEQCATAAGVTDGPEELERAATRLRDWQRPVLGSKSCFRAAVIPEAAHDINLHKNAPQVYAQIAYFADQAMGSDGAKKAAYRAECQAGADPFTDLFPHVNAPGSTLPPDAFRSQSGRGPQGRRAQV